VALPMGRTKSPVGTTLVDPGKILVVLAAVVPAAAEQLSSRAGPEDVSVGLG